MNTCFQMYIRLVLDRMHKGKVVSIADNVTIAGMNGVGCDRCISKMPHVNKVEGSVGSRVVASR